MSRKQYGMLVVMALVAGLIGGVASSWVLSGLPVLAQQTPLPAKVIQAEKFELVDREGKIRAILDLRGMLGSPGTEGPALRGPALRFYDEAGRVRTTLGLPAESPILQFDDEAGRPGAVLNLTSKGPILLLAGEDPRRQVLLTRDFLEVVDNVHDKRVSLGPDYLHLSGKDATISLSAGAEAAHSLIHLGTGSAGGPALDLLDKDGKTRATLGYTELKNTRTGSEEKRSPASLVLFGEDGKVIWEAP